VFWRKKGRRGGDYGHQDNIRRDQPLRTVQGGERRRLGCLGQEQLRQLRNCGGSGFRILRRQVGGGGRSSGAGISGRQGGQGRGFADAGAVWDVHTQLAAYRPENGAERSRLPDFSAPPPIRRRRRRKAVRSPEAGTFPASGGFFLFPRLSWAEEVDSAWFASTRTGFSRMAKHSATVTPNSYSGSNGATRPPNPVRARRRYRSSSFSSTGLACLS